MSRIVYKVNNSVGDPGQAKNHVDLSTKKNPTIAIFWLGLNLGPVQIHLNRMIRQNFYGIVSNPSHQLGIVPKRIYTRALFLDLPIIKGIVSLVIDHSRQKMKSLESSNFRSSKFRIFSSKFSSE